FAREACAEAQARVAEIRALVAEQYETEFASLKEAEEKLTLADQMVRQVALAHYEVTKDTNPHAAVTVAVSHVPQYDDAEALEWARKTGMALIPESLDKKALEKIAKATTLPFVKMVDKPSIRVASDLAAAL